MLFRGLIFLRLSTVLPETGVGMEVRKCNRQTPAVTPDGFSHLTRMSLFQCGRHDVWALCFPPSSLGKCAHRRVLGGRLREALGTRPWGRRATLRSTWNPEDQPLGSSSCQHRGAGSARPMPWFLPLAYVRTQHTFIQSMVKAASGHLNRQICPRIVLDRAPKSKPSSETVVHH